MKRLFFIICFLIIILISCSLAFNFFYGTKYVSAFKKEIIEKTSLNIDFTSINFSILKNFPYASFTLEEVNVFYSKESHKDTLLYSKKLMLKVNLLKFIKHDYEFAEIVISNARINIKADEIDKLFDTGKTESNSYIIRTHRVAIENSKLKYSYKQSFNVFCKLNKAYVSGVFRPNQLSAKLRMKLTNLVCKLNDYQFKNDDELEIKTSLIGSNGEYITKDGVLNRHFLSINFSSYYSSISEDLNITIEGNNVNATNVFSDLGLNNIKVLQGQITFKATYKYNFKNSNSERFSINYSLYNLKLKNVEDFTVSSLSGHSTFWDNFSKNESDVSSFTILAKGLKVTGNLKIKGLPQPYILLDAKFNTNQEVSHFNELTFNGDLNGKVKSLFKVENIKTLDLNSLKVIKLSSSLSFKHVSFLKYNWLDVGPGNLEINENSLRYSGDCKMYKQTMNCNLEIPQVFDVLRKRIEPSVSLMVEMDRLSVDSILTAHFDPSDNSQPITFSFKGKIHEVSYNGYLFKNFYTDIKYKNGNFICNQFSTDLFSGDARGHFNIDENKRFNLFLETNAIQIKDLFKCFKNFGQSYITHTNINGRLTGKTLLSFNLNQNKKIITNSLKLKSSITIEKGNIWGVNQLDKISKLLNINELDSIRFNTIKNDIQIEQGKVCFPEMLINSNILNFNISGEHYLSGDFTYWFKINLKEVLIKKYHLNSSKNDEYERDKNGELNIFLKYYGNQDYSKISLDKKNTVEHFKTNVRQEGIILKSLINEEIKSIKEGNVEDKDVSTAKKTDSLSNKTNKKPFKIEWDEIDSTKLKAN